MIANQSTVQSFSHWIESPVKGKSERNMNDYFQGYMTGHGDGLAEAERARAEVFLKNFNQVSEVLHQLYGELETKHHIRWQMLTLKPVTAYHFEAKFVLGKSRFYDSDLRERIYQKFIDVQTDLLRSRKIRLTIGLLPNSNLNMENLRSDGFNLEYVPSQKARKVRAR